MTHSIHDIRIISISQFADMRGKLCVINGNLDLPFTPQRVFFSYEIPPNVERGGHAHRECLQFIICLRGSFEIEFHDSFNSKKLQLSENGNGVYVPSGIWVIQRSFSQDAISLVLASQLYEENDYIREYSAFVDYKRQAKH